MKKQYLMLIAVCTLPLLIWAQVDNRVQATYNLKESHRATLPEGMTWEEVPFVLKNHLKPVDIHQKVTEKVKNDYSIETVKEISYRGDEEDWMNLPYRFELTCSETRAYDKNDNLLATIEANDENNPNFCLELREETLNFGYSPGYLIFPVPDINARDLLLDQGLFLDTLAGGVFILRNPTLQVIEFYDPKSYTIHQIQLGDSMDIEITEIFEPSDIWGFLPLKKIVRKTLKNGIVIIDEEVYTNFEIAGYIEPMLPEARPQHSQSGVSLNPNPVANITHVSLTNQTNQIQSIKVYDFYGQQLLQVDGNGFSEQQLDLSTLQAQLYLLRVETLNGEYHLTFQKQ